MHFMLKDSLPPSRSTLVDIYLVHTDSEWQMASRLARLMTDIGYTVASAHRAPAVGPEPLPADAAAVIVIWPLTSALFQKPALEARAAAQRGHLVQICSGQARPDESYGGGKVISFAGWDYAPTGAEWKALLRQLRPLCGAPPRPRIDPVAATPTAVIAVTVGAAVASMVFALGQSGNERQQQAAPTPRDAPETGPVQLAAPAPTPRATDVSDNVVLPDSGLGGPEAYDKDLGFEVGVAPAEVAPEAPEPRKRDPQGPER